MANVDDTPGDVDTDLPDDTWTVAEVNEEIAAVLEAASDRFPAYVVGELSDIKHYEFGTFFDLRDLEGDALVSCLAWSHVVDGLDHDMEEGTSAVVRADVEYHAEKGNCQLMVRDCWPLGASARREELEELRAALEAEGLLDDDRKRSLPPYPRCVGVVTSHSGSAREDVCSAIHDRAPGTRVKLCDATVQGERAIPSVIGAIERLDRDAEVEVLVVTRGGGADADLWCFNAEPLVRRLVDTRTPVVAAIGHEDDRTLTDDVADVRCMTPTDAGVKAAPDMAVVRRGLGDRERRIDDAYTGLVDRRLADHERRVERAHDALRQAVATRRAERRGQRERAAALEARIDASYQVLVTDRLDALADRLDAALREREHAAETEAVTARAARSRVADLEARIESSYRSRVEREVSDIETRIEAAYREREHAAETEAVTARAARSRVADLEARIDASYRSRVEREVSDIETRIEAAYREREADARVAAGTAQARRLRVVVAVLLVLLLLGGVAVAALVLGVL